MNITILTAFGDNYIYLLEYSPGLCFGVDPGDAKPVLEALESQRLKLTHVFITHHHADHIGGVSSLKQKTSCEVMGPDKQRMPGLEAVHWSRQYCLQETHFLCAVVGGCLNVTGRPCLNRCKH
ncbi:MAG: MBL fold metallo-hydrolase [Planctomycetota bacterium]